MTEIDITWNESETRAELIDPQLKAYGWSAETDVKVFREYKISKGRLIGHGKRNEPEIADYVLQYKNTKLAVVEAKKVSLHYTEGVAQAKTYAEKLKIRYTYSTNGKQIYQIDMETAEEKEVSAYPTPQELWEMTFPSKKEESKFLKVPFEDRGGTFEPRYYQELAVNSVLEALTKGKNRILLTLATGTGKTAIAFQIAWKLFESRWNINNDNQRRPRILFLADRNILADQAFNSFSAFPEDALIRIAPDEIKKKGRVPKNGSIFFTIFQTFMSGANETPYFGDYEKDFFDFIIIDECHRGGANDESRWKDILNYFSPAVHLGLTATPKRDKNIDTYNYFGEPVYTYSLKDGINDGFLTPFKVKQIKTTLDEYIYEPDDEVIEGEIEESKVYTEADFNKIIEIQERERARVKLFMEQINQNEKTLVFCATQRHALAIRNLINQNKTSKNPHYCERVTADDGKLGEQYLRQFQDNEKTIPTILTTSQKLSTGVDAKNVRNIVLLRPVNSMIEFKQIIGRGTRLFEGKDYFTIYDFVEAYKHFADPTWDGEPLDPTPIPSKVRKGDGEPPVEEPEPPITDEPPLPKQITRVKLRDGKEREIQHMTKTTFWGANGKPISVEEYLKQLFETLPEFFKNEDELRKIWSSPETRKMLLKKLSDKGYNMEDLHILEKLINAEKSDIFDVLSYVAFATQPIERKERADRSKVTILSNFASRQHAFIEFVLSQYVENGVTELDEERLASLINLKYHSVSDGINELGAIEEIKKMFCGFQKYLYENYAKVRNL